MPKQKMPLSRSVCAGLQYPRINERLTLIKADINYLSLTNADIAIIFHHENNKLKLL